MQCNTQIKLLIVCLVVTNGLTSAAEESLPSVKELPAPFKADEFKKHAVYLASDELAGRAPGSEGSAKAAAYIVRHFEQFGLKPIREDGSWFQEFPLGAPDRSSGSVTAKNLLAVLAGRGKLSREAIIVSAHYDHLGTKTARRAGEDTIFNGADDNASGVSALLLVAQALANDKASLHASHRTVIFISFDGEEQGLLGARFYAERPLWPLDKTAANINFDAMGRLRMGKFFASDASTNRMLAETVRDAATARRLNVETRFGGAGWSDHAVFVDHSIPSMHFFTGANPDYHQVTDHSDRLNFDGGANIAWVGYQVLRKAIAYPGHIDFQKTDPTFDMSFLMNLVQALGLIPNVTAQQGRYPQILAVVPNSPSAKAGIEAGDQITAINGLPFLRVEDGINIFQQLTLEDGIRVSVLRKTGKRDVTIPGSVFQALSGPKSKRLDNGKYDVEFRYQAAPTVKAVYLAGEFNAWKATALPMDGPGKTGLFTKHVQLGEGSYEYKFVIEGKDWTPDPQNVYHAGKYDNSLLWVGTRHK